LDARTTATCGIVVRIFAGVRGRIWASSASAQVIAVEPLEQSDIGLKQPGMYPGNSLGQDECHLRGVDDPRGLGASDGHAS
jgi:hypothetical protein